ncbi:MAG: two-component sensor histidine kinase [Alkalinema sp. CACIAM 70d]|nr:MAG: two-component sensor histidine kinase [Alkalinema sp. CACIAM 70d]
MKMHSFQLRLTLFSTLLAGLTLVGFAGLSWKLIYDAKVSRLDSSLANALKRAGIPRSENRWQSVEAFLHRELGVSANTQVGLLVRDGAGTVMHQSPDWAPQLGQFIAFPPRPTPNRNSANLPRLPLSPPNGNELPPNNARPNFRPDARPDTRLDTRPDFRPDRPPPEPPPIAILYRTQGAWRIGAASFPQTQIAIAVSLQSIDQEMAVIRNIFVIAIPAVLLLVAGGAWLLSAQALQPIQQLTHVIQKVSSKGLDQRVSDRGIDREFVELIQVFNQMLERLEQSFKQASRFSADAAHELKTPLTILQGELEQALQQAETGSPLQQQLGNLLDEVRRLSSIVRKLLLLSLADAGQMRLFNTEVNLSAMLLEMLEDFDLLAPELTIKTDIAAALAVWGDRDLLTQVLQNLFSNAMKYNLPNGWIEIQAQLKVNQISVTVRNASRDLPAYDRQHIFDRFHRGDPARTRKIEGTGLGLSLAREIARAHGGDLQLETVVPGQTAFVLTLPSRKLH